MKSAEPFVRPNCIVYSIRRRFAAVAAICFLLLLPASLPAQVEGGPRDGGAWSAGDFWRFDRQFSLRIDDLAAGSIGTIVFNERFTQTVASPATSIATNGIDGPQRVYLRNRSAGTVTGNGVWFVPQGGLTNLASMSVLFTVLPSANSSGFDWRRVSDLAEVRESFAVNGTIRARLTAFTTLGAYYDNANMTTLMTVNIDNGPALEFADFPLDQIGEEWTMAPTRRLSGTLANEREDMSLMSGVIAIPATTVTYPLDTTEQQTFIQNYAATGVTAPLIAGGTFPNTERIDAASPSEGDTLHWSGAAKEFADHTTGVTSALDPLYGFRTSLSGTLASDYGVTPDSGGSNITFSPLRPSYGSPFIVSWTGGGTRTVRLRDHAGNESTDTGTSPLTLTSPSVDDDSPMSGANADLGSYGVEFITGGVNVDLATVRLEQVGPPGPGNDDFADLYTLYANSAANGTNVNATREPGEPLHAGMSGTSSVWWDYEGQPAPCSPGGQYGTLIASVAGATTLLAVYIGDSVGGLSLVGSASAAPGFSASMFFYAQNGYDYKIAVDSVGGQGSVSLFYGFFPSPTPCNTASPTPSPTPTFTPHITHTATPTKTATPTPSRTATATPTPTVTATCTFCFEPEPSSSPSRTPTPTPSRTPTPTPSRTATPTPTPTATVIQEPTPSHNPSPTPSRTATPTPGPEATTTPTANCTSVPSPAPSYPFNGATDVPVDVTLTWNPSGCSNFTVRLDPGTTASTVICTGAFSSCDPPGDLLPGTTYAWRLSTTDCVLCAVPSYFSGDIVFTTAGAAPSPTPDPTASPSPVFPSPTPVCCPGDADNSMGQVNAQDFLAVQSAFGMDNGPGGLGDADCSGGAVNAQDFLAVQANFGMSCG